MMERRVKERLIGASVLVVLIVLIVPEMLSGPRQPPSAPPLTVGLPAPNRTVSVDLTTSTATAEPDTAEGASASAPPPAGGRASGAASESAVASGAATADGAPESAPPEHAAPTSSPTVTTLQAQEPAGGSAGGPSGAPSATPSGSALETPPSGPKSGMSGSAAMQAHRGCAEQLGSFASRANADKLMHQLQARGGSSLYVSSSGSGSSLRYRVRMGPLPDRGAAERAAGRLRAGGHPSTVVAPNS
jgi:DedD protein